MWSLSPNSYKAAFAVVFAVLVGIGITSYVMSDRFANSEESVIHTHEVISELKSVSAELSEAESARWGFVLIGDRTLLIEFDVARETLPRHLQSLQSKTVDNPRQQQGLAQLQPLVAQRLALLHESIQSQQQSPASMERQLELTRQGVALDDRIRPLLDDLEQEEYRLLLDRSRVSATRQHRATMLLVLAFLLASMLLVSLFLIMSAEVTRRAWAEAEAKENEEKFRLLVNGIQDHAVIRVDLEGRITTWNLGAKRLFGFDYSEILGEPFHRLYNACEQDTPQRHLKTALEVGHVNDECKQIRKDGTQFWATADITLLRDEQSQPRGYAVITRDITERRQQREEIEHREAQLNAFFSNAPVGLAIIDKDLCFQRINEPFAQLNRLDSNAQVGKPLKDVIADLSHQIDPLLRKVARTGEPILNQEIRGPVPSTPGVTGWWLKSFFPIAKDGNVVTQMGIVVQDITGLKRAETSVRRLSGRLLQIRDDERRRLARDLHDSLGQTLTAVKLNLSYLGRDTSNLDERGQNAVTESKELIDNALKEVRTLSHLLHPPMLDDVGLVAAIRWFTNGFAQRSSIQVDLSLPANLPRLPTELETAIFRVVQESLTNVHRHSGSATAAVRMETEADRLHLFVIDQGRGMTSDQLLFRPENAIIGVGLLGMRERLRQLRGELEITSSSDGTRIHVIIPLSEAA
ncbi:MAG TPA: PAS domain-containing protein [Terriglobales bacterium]